jgi:circadian clock protein KaiC
MLTRFGLEEYVSDCVISLDHRVVDQVTTRRIRVVKYRGSTHGTNEYPFLIEKDGISIWPITSVQLDHVATLERIPTGIERLDTMLDGQGFYRGSSILLSGTAGTGKTSMAATFADATCRRGERCLYFSFEESPSQIMRNMGTIGLDLQQWVKKGRLQFQAMRPFYHGLEMHLARTIKFITEFTPDVVIIDPISGLDTTGAPLEIKSALMRLIDFLKLREITAMLTDLTLGGSLERSDAAISPLVDTWVVLRDLETNGERNRGLHILKSRGMASSNQVREFMVTDNGIQLTDVYIGPSGMLTGSARVQQEGRERAELVSLSEEAERQQLALECKRAALEAQIAALRAEFSGEEAIITRTVRKDAQRGAVLALDEAAMGRSRKGDAAKPHVVKSNGKHLHRRVVGAKQ